MTTLKQAQADPKAMSQFIAEHDGLAVESERFERVMSSMIGSGKSSKGRSGDFLDDGGDCT